jgi:hypothetical protein
MPQADFYAGLPLAEQLQKLVDHHHDRAVRHISSDEAAILELAVTRLRAGVPRLARAAEFDDAWRRLEHLYETTVWSSEIPFSLVASSMPTRGNGVPETVSALLPASWIIAEAPATARLVQLALNVTFKGAVDPASNAGDLWAEYESRRSPPADQALGSAENELLNRALYQPTIAVEGSPPSFTSLADYLAKVAGPAWVAVVAETSQDPATVVAAGSVILVLSVSKTVLGGAAQGLSDGLKERLYEWSRPKAASNATTKGAAPTNTSKGAKVKKRAPAKSAKKKRKQP